MSVSRGESGEAAGCTVAEFGDAYWPYRLDYDRAVLDAAGYWQRVAGNLGRSFDGAQIAELARLDIASWMHLQEGTVALIEDMAAAGHRLALLSNAPADVAEAVSGLPVAAHFEHLIFSCFLKSAKPDPESTEKLPKQQKTSGGRPDDERRRGGGVSAQDLLRREGRL